MTIRQTSIDALKSIRDSGLLGERQLQAYEYVFNFGPCTAAQISNRVPGGWKRVSELVRDHMVHEAGDTTDPNTNQTVTLWDVTGRTVPLKPKLKKMKRCCKLRSEKIRTALTVTTGPFETLEEALDAIRLARDALRIHQ